MSGMSRRGAARVGNLSDLTPVEAGAVLFLRLWADGEGTQPNKDVAWSPNKGDDLALWSSLEQIAALCDKHGRRPLVRHSVGCCCLGADENCFAMMVGAAADGAREDAMLLASLMVRADVAPMLAALSEEFGLILRRMSGSYRHPATTRTPPVQVLH